MPRTLCITGTVIAALLLLLFGLDLVVGVPFNTASQVVDIGLVVSGGILAYLSWSTLREQA